MHYEEIGDPVEVIALFRAGQMSPLRFRWKNRVYKVERVNGRWSTDEGYLRCKRFAVSAGGPDIYELSYAIETQHWELARVGMNG
jgi:hypothetical protein